MMCAKYVSNFPLPPFISSPYVSIFSSALYFQPTLIPQGSDFQTFSGHKLIPYAPCPPLQQFAQPTKEDNKNKIKY
jgi:hypothetical protein